MRPERKKKRKNWIHAPFLFYGSIKLEELIQKLTDIQDDLKKKGYFDIDASLSYDEYEYYSLELIFHGYYLETDDEYEKRIARNKKAREKARIKKQEDKETDILKYLNLKLKIEGSIDDILNENKEYRRIWEKHKAS